ncbi:hypothetical protein ACPXCO_23020 [Streptomyces cyaneofuscatus]|uniref:hypothetical protein n=1 Tax=Streptomyces cyaneofuscatus TaxID=66883 RepID=UPI003CEC2751
MGHQIIEQPDGLLAVFSSVVSSFVVTDATPEELIDWYADEAARDARERTKRLLDRVAQGAHTAYAQHALTWEEASQIDQECSSGPDES